jgi:hypothetical protein
MCSNFSTLHLRISRRSVGLTWNNGGRVECFEGLNEKNWYTQYRTITETLKLVVFQCKQHDLNLKFLCLEELLKPYFFSISQNLITLEFTSLV